MHVSTKGRYGARAMLSLATHYNGDYVSTSKIAEEQEISTKYLEKLLGLLKAADLVTSAKGVQGGYAITRSPEDISLYDILVPLGENLDIVFCTEEEDMCHRTDRCVTRGVWMEIREAVITILKRTTLADLCKRLETLEAKNGS